MQEAQREEFCQFLSEHDPERPMTIGEFYELPSEYRAALRKEFILRKTDPAPIPCGTPGCRETLIPVPVRVFVHGEGQDDFVQHWCCPRCTPVLPWHYDEDELRVRVERMGLKLADAEEARKADAEKVFWLVAGIIIFWIVTILTILRGR